MTAVLVRCWGCGTDCSDSFDLIWVRGQSRGVCKTFDKPGECTDRRIDQEIDVLRRALDTGFVSYTPVQLIRAILARLDSATARLARIDDLHKPAPEPSPFDGTIDCVECGDPWPCPTRQTTQENP